MRLATMIPVASLPAGEFRVPSEDGQGGPPDQPLVVLIGWWGSQPKHVRKYSEALWLARGCTTLILIPQTVHMFSRKHRQGLANSLIATLTSQPSSSSVERPLLAAKQVGVVFHLFSNNGALFFADLLSVARGEVLGLVRGVIYDSCPGHLTLWNACAAVAARHTTGPRALVARFCTLAVPAWVMVSMLRSRRPALRALLLCCLIGLWRRGEARITREYHTALRDARLPGCRAELFLYSNGDTLCTSDGIDVLFAARLALLGHDSVSRLRWEDSPHVAHFREHPQQYAEACAALLSRLKGS